MFGKSSNILWCFALDGLHNTCVALKIEESRMKCFICSFEFCLDIIFDPTTVKKLKLSNYCNDLPKIMLVGAKSEFPNIRLCFSSKFVSSQS